MLKDNDPPVPVYVGLPAGLSTPEGQARFKEAERAQDQAVTDAANKLAEGW